MICRHYYIISIKNSGGEIQILFIYLHFYVFEKKNCDFFVVVVSFHTELKKQKKSRNKFTNTAHMRKIYIYIKYKKIMSESMLTINHPQLWKKKYIQLKLQRQKKVYFFSCDF